MAPNNTMETPVVPVNEMSTNAQADSNKAVRPVPFLAHSALPYLCGYLPFLLSALGLVWGGWYNYMTFALAFVIIPLLDIIIGLDDYNPTKEQEKMLEKKLSFRLVTWVWVPMQVALVFWSCWFIGNNDMTLLELIGAATAVGICGGLGINVAHELIHKPGTLEPALGRTALATVCYGHFYTEHLLGHHKRVSTPNDPATSRLGETFYSFWLRCVPDSFTSAWEIERVRLAKKGHSEWSLRNQVLIGALSSVAVAAAVGATAGAAGVAFFAVQSFLAFSLLEVINYIEHYGLVRAPKPSVDAAARPDYVRVTPMHSWNAGHRITNYFLFKLQRHSDHHASAGRRYQILRSFTASPQMPTGYAGMLLMALVPPVWFAVMNPRVAAVRARAAEYDNSGIDPFKEY
eukprot:Opistho-2@64915